MNKLPFHCCSQFFLLLPYNWIRIKRIQAMACVYGGWNFLSDWLSPETFFVLMLSHFILFIYLLSQSLGHYYHSEVNSPKYLFHSLIGYIFFIVLNVWQVNVTENFFPLITITTDRYWRWEWNCLNFASLDRSRLFSCCCYFDDRLFSINKNWESLRL